MHKPKHSSDEPSKIETMRQNVRIAQMRQISFDGQATPKTRAMGRDVAKMLTAIKDRPSK